MPAHGYERLRGVRWRDDVGFEMWCPDCARQGDQCFWPITTEYWDVHTTLQRCRACGLARKRAAERKRKAQNREAINAKNRAYYAANAELLKFKDAQRRRARKAA